MTVPKYNTDDLRFLALAACILPASGDTPKTIEEALRKADKILDVALRQEKWIKP